MKKALKTIARKTPLYPLYRFLANRLRVRRFVRQCREWSDEDQTRFDFYRQFINPGDVVFDVGANMGNRAKIFTELGAIVVAVEPQAECSDFLFAAFGNKANFHLVRKALGAEVGQAEMLISNAHTISSLSHDWVRSVKESGRFAGYEWNRKEIVPVDTLDNLIARYGCPVFVKIDVEGFEGQVIAGLSSPVGAVSMEFTPEYMDNTLQCIDHLCRIGDAEFQISIGESMEFLLPQWVNPDEIRTILSEVPAESFGDLYARFNAR
ncbi:MAG: FkbM family methyltransferase [Thiogranum sp.]|nr:FkbM family methyltransferase [Thiogranum sp.]